MLSVKTFILYETDKYWSVEWSFTFEALAKESQRMQPAPSADEVWFLNFGRYDVFYQRSSGYKMSSFCQL